MGQQIVLFSPLDTEGRTHAYNPLDFVSKDRALRINDIQAITSKLVVSHAKADPIWANEGRTLLDGLILFLLDAGKRATLGAVYRMTSGLEGRCSIQLSYGRPCWNWRA